MATTVCNRGIWCLRTEAYLEFVILIFVVKIALATRLDQKLGFRKD